MAGAVVGLGHRMGNLGEHTVGGVVGGEGEGEEATSRRSGGAPDRRSTEQPSRRWRGDGASHPAFGTGGVGRARQAARHGRGGESFIYVSLKCSFAPVYYRANFICPVYYFGQMDI